MSASFFFYDLETSGISAFDSRIMQFAGRRTDLDLNPIGDPVNVMIRMTEDQLPDPYAIMVTGITPQATIADGITEYEFLQLFTREVALPGTIFAGFNTVRFDDEFVRSAHYRNFYDPYEWQWQDDRSKWDLLDVVRMTRALRPDGIKWPVDSEGKPTNRLELLTSINGLEHANAHDALSDVDATIDMARLIRGKQQKLFDFLLGMRDKRKVEELVTGGQPFVYSSGKYPSEFQKTTVGYTICNQPKRQGVFVYDLRHDPTQYATMTPEQLAEAWRWKKDREAPRMPVKTMQFNKCPAVAPMGVLDAASQERLQIDLSVISKHLAILKSITDLDQRLCKAWDILEAERPQQATMIRSDQDVDASIYDGFIDNADKRLLEGVRTASPEDLGEATAKSFKDERLKLLLPLYKARNFRDKLTSDERLQWENFCRERLLGGGKQNRMVQYMARLQELSVKPGLTENQRYVLQDLQLYAESIMPAAADEY